MGIVIQFPASAEPACDLQFCNAGSFVTMMPVTDAGREWVFNNIIDEESDTLWPIHIEHRYLADIVEGARADGLVCEG